MSINHFVGEGYVNSLTVGEFNSGNGRWAQFTLKFSAYAGKNDDGTSKYENGYLTCKAYSPYIIDRLEGNVPRRDEDTLPPAAIVSGEIRYDTWETPEGDKRSQVYVRVNEISFTSRTPVNAQAANKVPAMAGGRSEPF